MNICKRSWIKLIITTGIKTLASTAIFNTQMDTFPYNLVYLLLMIDHAFHWMAQYSFL